MRVRLERVAFDAGTQIRAAIDPQVVTDYAEAMTSGATFPPIVLFHDGNQHYLADGFHRFMAAQRLAFVDIDADVRAGTKEDALWFALGANRVNGHRLTDADKKHAILIALSTWPEMANKQIAEQSGCSYSYVQRLKSERMAQDATGGILPSRVVGKDGKSYPASRPTNKTTPPPPPAFKSKAAVAQRREQMREMAASGHTSRQIAAAVGITEEGCRAAMREEGIDVPADRVVGKQKHHDSNRIVDRMVGDAENLTADVNLISFADLDRERLGEWADSLAASRRALDSFIRRLIKEQQKHGEAA